MTTEKPRARAARRTSTKDADAFKRAFLREWAGTWATNPKTPQDRKGASLLHAATSFTQAGSVIAPVAIAAVDILGMRALLETMSLEQIATQFAEPFYDLDGPGYRASNVSVSVREMERLGFRRMADIMHVEISDTVLLARRPDWELCGDATLANANAVVELAGYVATVTKVNSLHGISLRSALAFGECLLSVGGQLALLGAPTREASDWERCQEWVGGMLTQSAVKALRRGAEAAKKINGDDFVPRYPNWLVPYPVPVKPTATAMLPTPCIALNWITGKMPGPWMYHARLPQMPENANSDVRRKVENTNAFAEYVAKVGDHTTIEWS